MSPERVAASWVAHLDIERKLAPATLTAYRRYLSRYHEHLRGRGRVELGDVTRADVEDFVTLLRTDPQRPLCPESITVALAAVRGMHRFAHAEGYASVDPSVQVRPPLTVRRLPRPLPADQVVRLIEATDPDTPAGARDRALLELLYATGARISEAVALDTADVIGTDGGVRGAVHLLGKGGKERIVPVGSHARGALAYWLTDARPQMTRAPDGPLFVGARGSRVSRQSAWSIVQAAARRAGLGPVSPHVLRHSLATHLLDGGADVRVVQELLGHASVTTTQIYTEVSPLHLRATYDAAHPRAREKASVKPDGHEAVAPVFLGTRERIVRGSNHPSPEHQMAAVPDAWSHAMRGWVTWYQVREVSPQTVALRTYHLRRFANWTARPGPFDVGSQDLVDHLGATDWKPETRRSVRASLKSFYTWAHGAGLTATNIAAALPTIKMPEPNPRPVPTADYERVVRTSDERIALAVRLAGSIGLRRAEVVSIHADDITESASGLKLKVHGKGNKTRKIPLPDDLGRDLVAWIARQDGGWAFPAPDGKGPMTSHWLGTLVARVLPTGFTMHKLRHRALTLAYRHSKDIHLVMSLAGHSSIATTSKYYLEPDDEALRKTVEGIA